MASIPLMYVQEDCEQGGKEDIENDFAYRNNVQNASKEIRLAFIRKVYGLLSIQLMATFAISAVFIMVEPVKLYIQQNTWMMLMAFCLSFVTLVALMIKRRDSPANLYLLAAFTVVQAYSVGVVVSFCDLTVVLQAVALTFLVVSALTAFTFNTKRDFSMLGYGLFAGLSVLILGGFLQFFIQNSLFEMTMSVVGVVLFSLFLVFDTQMILVNLSPEEYILATINLYLDIINMFLNILRILSESSQ